MQDYQQSVIDERSELDGRITRLQRFIASSAFTSLDIAERQRLESQRFFMLKYRHILNLRIAAFSQVVN